MKKYVEKGGIDQDELEYVDCLKRFRFGENTYESKTKVEHPVVVKDVTGDNIKKKVLAYMIDKKRKCFYLARKKWWIGM